MKPPVGVNPIVVSMERTVADRRHAGAVAEMRDDGAAEGRRADRRDDVLVRQAVEPVAPDALRPEPTRERQALGHRRHAPVEGAVEARDLRHAGEAGRDGLHARDRRRQMQGCERRERPQPRDQPLRDALGRGVVGSAVDDTMADGIGRRELAGVELGEASAQRCADVGEHARRRVADVLRVVPRREEPAVGPDPLDRDRREPRLAVEERELQRRRAAVETEDVCHLLTRASASSGSRACPRRAR